MDLYFVFIYGHCVKIKNEFTMKKIIKMLLPKSAITTLKKMIVIMAEIDAMAIVFFSKNGFLASLYYTFFSRQFYREHKAVLKGRIAYRRSVKQGGASSILLRRNVHRLEKGLIMRPRRDIFAEDYIQETVDCYLLTVESSLLCRDEQQWALDVLSNYFDVVGQTAKIDKARKMFSGCQSTLARGENTPYPHRDLPACPVEYEQLYTLFKRRRSVRWYQNKPVEMAAIRQAVNAAALAPSACNRQPFNFYVINDSDKASDIAKCAMGTAGFADNLPCLIAVVGNLNAYPAERDRHIIYIDGALASMQLMLALETLGISTCAINWPDIEPRESALAKKLDLKYHERTIMLLAVGYAEPEGGIPFSQKKNDNLLIKVVK